MTACIACLGLGEPQWTFSLPVAAGSQNKGGFNKGAAMHSYRRARGAWIGYLSVMARHHKIPPATGRRAVRITRQYSGLKRPFDYGNLVGGLKAVVDAMQREIGGKAKAIPGAGLIVDDSEKWFVGIYEQRKGASDCVVFELWDV